jgi:hypothetical protein
LGINFLTCSASFETEIEEKLANQTFLSQLPNHPFARNVENCLKENKNFQHNFEKEFSNFHGYLK